MARARRMIVHNTPYFITCRVLPGRLTAAQVLALPVFDALARAGDRWGAELHGYVIMPDHWHALVTTYPPHDISAVMDDVKTAATSYFNGMVEEAGHLWQPRFHDHVCRNQEDYGNSLRYVHFNPVEAGFVARPGDWPWSSWYAYAEGGTPPLPVTPVDADFDAMWAEWGRQPPPRRRRRPADP